MLAITLSLVPPLSPEEQERPRTLDENIAEIHASAARIERMAGEPQWLTAADDADAREES